jgi:ribosomal protein S18 acetylase RimI-like enzyme
MAQPVQIREARNEELAEVEALVKNAYREFQPLMPAVAWDGWMANISEALRDPGGAVLVADHGGKIRGAVAFYPDAAQARQGQWPAGAAAIRMLAVRPEHRGRGYGRLLTQACLDRARILGITAIYLYTGTFMTAARWLYEELGFHRAPAFDHTPGPIAYRLDLS